MTLRFPLTLSASGLKALESCPRLFRFRFLDKHLWPVIDPEILAALQRGQQFHRLVELQAKGREVEPRLPSVDAQVQTWWSQFQKSEHAHPQGEVQSELSLWTELWGVRWTARLDRLVMGADHLHILDWKTDRRRPADAQIRDSWQVRLYPLLVLQLGSLFLGDRPLPEAIHLTFWYAQHPDQPFRMQYTEEQWQQDYADLERIVGDLDRLQAEQFPRTPHLSRCAGCAYRSRCYGLLPDQVSEDLLPDWEGLDLEAALDFELS
ncbi:MAG: PD-(D/E)XK nuclease family protein [Synechococcaceae cyanobacterium SM2_3_1]|nr:PD-(D/E)XK nuclease family protein [Synechococcaceae cyanobacterium SM2_3_1]